MMWPVVLMLLWGKMWFPSANQKMKRRWLAGDSPQFIIYVNCVYILKPQMKIACMDQGIPINIMKISPSCVILHLSLIHCPLTDCCIIYEARMCAAVLKYISIHAGSKSISHCLYSTSITVFHSYLSVEPDGCRDRDEGEECTDWCKSSAAASFPLQQRYCINPFFPQQVWSRHVWNTSAMSTNFFGCTV